MESRSIHQGTASQAKESEARNIPEMGEPKRSQVSDSNVACRLRNGFVAKPRYRLAVRSTSLHDRIS